MFELMIKQPEFNREEINTINDLSFEITLEIQKEVEKTVNDDLIIIHFLFSDENEHFKNITPRVKKMIQILYRKYCSDIKWVDTFGYKDNELVLVSTELTLNL